jgi:hypothetical protein
MCKLDMCFFLCTENPQLKGLVIFNPAVGDVRQVKGRKKC